MVEHYVGPQDFQRGVHNYMEAHKFGNATAEDFWDHQTEASASRSTGLWRALLRNPANRC